MTDAHDPSFQGEPIPQPRRSRSTTRAGRTRRTSASAGYEEGTGDFVERYSAGPSYSSRCPAGTSSIEHVEAHQFFSRSPEEQAQATATMEAS